MARIKFKQILLWGWKGIEVWNVFVSLGVPAVLRAAFHSVFNEWAWYDQLLLFGGIGLIILGILILIFRNRRWLGAKTEAGNQQREVLDFYERQRENWHSYIRLKLVRVASHTKAASPYLILTLEVHNYLPIDFKLVRVSETEGSVGQCNLPLLPENIDKKINACGEDQFEIKVGVHGTKIPEFLQSQEALGKPHLLQWYLKGVWYADIYGKIQPIKYKADALLCESLLSIME
jgi:L-lactate permease